MRNINIYLFTTLKKLCAIIGYRSTKYLVSFSKVPVKLRKLNQQNILLYIKLEHLLNQYWWTFVLIFWCSCFMRVLCFLLSCELLGVSTRSVVLNRGYTYPLGVWSTETRGTNHQIVSGIHALKFKPRHARPENLKSVFDCCECCKLYQRPCLELPRV